MSLRILAAATVVLAAAPAAAGNWQVDPDESRLGFIGQQLGIEFDGRFDRFEADIEFHPDDLAASAVSVTIDVASFDTGSGDRDSTAMGADWFAVDQYPQARFEADIFRHVEGDAFEASGRLTMKDVTRDVVLPFTLDFENGTAAMSGALTIDRVDYNVGIGQWANGDAVAREVTITIDLAATRIE